MTNAAETIAHARDAATDNAIADATYHARELAIALGRINPEAIDESAELEASFEILLNALGDLAAYAPIQMAIIPVA